MHRHYHYLNHHYYHYYHHYHHHQHHNHLNTAILIYSLLAVSDIDLRRILIITCLTLLSRGSYPLPTGSVRLWYNKGLLTLGKGYEGPRTPYLGLILISFRYNDCIQKPTSFITSYDRS